MTKLWIASDLHYGYGDTITPRAPTHDVFVCAGDFARLDEAIGIMNGGFYGNYITVLVPGNHEYYGGVIEDAEFAGVEAAGGTRVQMLNPGVAVIGGIRFVGCTLWTDFALFGDPAAAMAAAAARINDHRRIRTRDGCRPHRSRLFTPADALVRHQRERSWLELRLAEPFDGPTVVISHHGPSPRSVPDRFRNDPLSPSFSSDLEDMIVRHQPDMWVHGHTHDAFDYQIGRTRVICNPAGYSYEIDRGYVWDLVVDLPTHDHTDEPDVSSSPAP